MGHFQELIRQVERELESIIHRILSLPNRPHSFLQPLIKELNIINL